MPLVYVWISYVTKYKCNPHIRQSSCCCSIPRVRNVTDECGGERFGECVCVCVWRGGLDLGDVKGEEIVR